MFYFILFFLPFFAFAQEIEIVLPTKSSKEPLYISRLSSEEATKDWRYIDELLSCLEFDLSAGGFFSLLPFDEALEKTANESEFKELVELKEKGVHYLLKAEFRKGALFLTAFDFGEKKWKKYPEIPLSKKIDLDRVLIHKFSDLLHKDLFGIEGIASLKILFAKRDVEPFALERSSEICLVDCDGANLRQLTFEEGYCVSPAFFPESDNTEFFYVNFKEGQSKIYVGSTLEKKKGEPLLSLRGNQVLPSISKGGKEMAFITDIAGRPDLFLQKLDAQKKPLGKARQLFTAPRATEASPSFSPNGKKVAFVSDKDGPPRIYVLDTSLLKSTEKPRPQLITKICRENTCPAWSPDGTKLAYSGKIDGVRQIWLYDFETKEEIQLTTGSEMKENPSWAPDSLHLVYNTESEESSELFLLDIRSHLPIQISKGPGQKRFPCFEIR